MSGKKKKKFTAEEKIVILKKHLLEKKAVSDICDEHVMPEADSPWAKSPPDDVL